VKFTEEISFNYISDSNVKLCLSQSPKTLEFYFTGKLK